MSSSYRMSSEYAGSSPLSIEPRWLVDLGLTTRYQVLELIGQGGMGEVWKAKDLTTGQLVALKVPNPQRAGDLGLLTRAELESQALLQLRDSGGHPCVVKVLDFFQNDHHACLVMEFIDGLDLRSWAQKKNPSIRELVEILALTSEGMGFCHERKLIHRDLKPQNIVIRGDSGVPVVVDFSISKGENQLPHTLTSEHPGTFPYMAPEQLNPELGPTTPASDVYGLGATLYEALTNVLPHPGHHAQVVERHLKEVSPAPPKVLNPEVPDELQWIVLKALSHRPADRYADAGNLAADLRRWLRNERVLARPKGLLTGFVRKVQQQKRLATALATCIAFATWISWREWSAAQHRRLDSLRQSVVRATEEDSWSKAKLDHQLQTLQLIEEDNPLLKEELFARLLSDIKGDARRALGAPRFEKNDKIWIKEITPWLASFDPAAAERISASLGSRLARWEVMYELSAPFENIQSMVQDGGAVITGHIIRPTPPRPGEKRSPSVELKPRLAPPFEIRTRFACPPSGNAGPGISFFWGNTKLRVRVDRVFRERTSGVEMSVAHGDEVPQTVFIPDENVWKDPLELTVRIMARTLYVTLNDQWSMQHDEDFVLIPSTTPCRMALDMPNQGRLRRMSILAPCSAEPSPLERGDTLAASGQWAKAQSAFESQLGQPGYEDEVAYKLGITLYQQGKIAEALKEWEDVANRKESFWQSNALCRLWIYYATRHSLAEARPYLLRLPDPVSVPWSYNLPAELRAEVQTAYHTAVRGLNLLKQNLAAVDDAVKAFRFTDGDPLLIANRFALARHMAGMDNTARELLKSALLRGKPLEEARQGKISRSRQLMALTALDVWLQFDHPSRDPDLKATIDAWTAALPDNTTVHAISLQAAARDAARAGRVAEALELIQPLKAETDLVPREIVHFHLMETALLQKLGRVEEAKEAAHRAAVATLSIARTPSWLTLSDEMAAHCYAATWTPDIATRIIGSLFGMTRPGQSGIELQERLGRPLLSAAGLDKELNLAVSNPETRIFLHSLAIRTQPASECMRGWFRVILNAYWSATFKTASPAQQTMLNQLTEEILAAFRSGVMDESDLITMVEDWQQPTAPSRLQPVFLRLSPKARDLMQQLFAAKTAQFNATANTKS